MRTSRRLFPQTSNLETRNLLSTVTAAVATATPTPPDAWDTESGGGTYYGPTGEWPEGSGGMTTYVDPTAPHNYGPPFVGPPSLQDPGFTDPQGLPPLAQQTDPNPAHAFDPAGPPAPPGYPVSQPAPAPIPVNGPQPVDTTFDPLAPTYPNTTSPAPIP